MNGFPWNYIWVVINLALIVFVFKRFLGRPLGALLEGRRQDIVNRFEQAGEATVTAESLRDQAAQRLTDVEREKKTLLDRASDRMRALSDEARQASEEESARIVERTRSGIARERDLAVKALWQRAAGRTVDATRLVLAGASDRKDDERLVRDLLSGLKEVDL